MATYEEQTINMQGQMVRRTLNDLEVKSYFPPQAVLTANKTTITADGVDFALVSIQLKSVPLSDGRQDNLPIAQKVILAIADLDVELMTDNTGFVSHEIAANDVGAYSVSVRNLASNVLTITGV